MPDKNIENIAIQDDLMFQKFISKRTIRYVELEILCASGTITRGYVTGLDDEWIQLTTTVNQAPALIQRHRIERISETDTKFFDLPKEAQENIKRFSTRFREICGNAVRQSESR